ncbi:hypothetical protein HXX76_010817 [Chlamydomonas incerta]|uniref:EF-hand domain-containing protein n=1 Tax=Chlamydomonas incerta TaxID=51695 RepID=A0A835VXK3_CHLIN|nr:hypothetical protein HXX76_010817 [Chlamydomonas incerta]|eukprot:KAG2429583.1 hypothetical protein HXX76_010817 [Chlamydomonas incerta]
MEVQRLLYLLEAPEYAMRAFREHGINGQDLLVLRDDDLEDPRFKFPRHVIRKVMRISTAWKVFQSITGSVTRGAITMEQYVAHYSYGRSPDVVTQLQAAYRVVDANSNGSLTFEEFLVGFSLLDAAVADTRRPAFVAGTINSGMQPQAPTSQTGINWFQL